MTPIWITALVFIGFLPWGANVPAGRPALVVKIVVTAAIVFHVITQSFYFQADDSPWASSERKAIATQATQQLENYLDRTALTPARLNAGSAWPVGQLITANFLHSGWIDLAINLWIFSLCGTYLENLFGRTKFAVFLLLAMVGSQMAVAYMTWGSPAASQFHGGFSGVLYATMAAYLVCFPRSKIWTALVYDLRFWGVALFIILPVTITAANGGTVLAETIFLLGVVGVFLVMEPEHYRVNLPAVAIVFYKLVQDTTVLHRHGDAYTVSPWAIVSGLVIGAVYALGVNGIRGLNATLEDPPDQLQFKDKRQANKVNHAKLEAAGRKDADAARMYLIQRIFVGDGARATQFYAEVVMPKFPDLILEAPDQMSLARMLSFRGMKAETVDAYEKMLKINPLPEGSEIAYLKIAQYLLETKSDRTPDALDYLNKFDAGTSLMRDKMEGQRIRAELLSLQRERESIPEQAPDFTPEQSSAATCKPARIIRSVDHSQGLQLRKCKPRTVEKFNPDPVITIPVAESDPIPLETILSLGSGQIDAAADRLAGGAPVGREQSGDESLVDYGKLGWQPLPLKFKNLDQYRRLHPSKTAESETEAPKTEPVGTPHKSKAFGSVRPGGSPGRTSLLELTGLTTPADRVKAASAQRILPGSYGSIEDLRDEAGAFPRPISKIKREHQHPPSEETFRKLPVERLKQLTDAGAEYGAEDSDEIQDKPSQRQENIPEA